MKAHLYSNTFRVYCRRFASYLHWIVWCNKRNANVILQKCFSSSYAHLKVRQLCIVALIVNISRMNTKCFHLNWPDFHLVWCHNKFAAQYSGLLPQNANAPCLKLYIIYHYQVTRIHLPHPDETKTTFISSGVITWSQMEKLLPKEMMSSLRCDSRANGDNNLLLLGMDFCRIFCGIVNCD